MPVLRTCCQHGGIAKRTKTARLRRNTQPFYHSKIRITWKGRDTSRPPQMVINPRVNCCQG